jgi:HSP20 family molecular chaperone IbpA
VQLEGNELVITGRRPLPDCCRDGDLKIWEIPLGQFERRLTVVDVEKTLSMGDVVLRDGLLLIELRKNS